MYSVSAPSQQVCEGSTGKRWPQGLENGLRVPQENKEFRARLEALEKEGRRESGLEEEWGVEMDIEDEAGSRKLLDEHKRKLQKELRDIDKFSYVPKEFQESLKSNLQQQLQEVEQRRHDLIPEHKKEQKRSQKMQSIQDKRRNLQKGSTAAEEESGSFRRSSSKKSSVSLSYRIKSIRTRCRMQKWRQSFTVCRGANGIETFVQRLQRGMEAAQGQMPGREEGRRTSEDEQEQDKASQQLALSGSSGCNEGTPASSLELDLPRIRGALGEGGRAGKSGKAKDERKRPLSNSPSRRPMDEEEDVAVGDL